MNTLKILENIQEIENHKWESINKCLRTANIQGMYFYKVKIRYQPSRINYHDFNLDILSGFGRKLINGMNSLAGVSNRTFWKKYFSGGFRIISVVQEAPNDFPAFYLNYIFYASRDNLDVVLAKSIQMRASRIELTLDTTIEYIGENLKFDDLENSFNVDENTDMLDKLGLYNKKEIFDIVFRPAVFMGELYKIRKNKNIMIK